MISDKKFTEIMFEGYTELFKAAIPSVSFQELIDTCTTYIDENNKEVVLDSPLSKDECIIRGYKRDLKYCKYWIPSDKFADIVFDIIKKYRLKNRDKDCFKTSIYLGCSPTSSIRRWLNEHPEYTIYDFKNFIEDRGYILSDKEHTELTTLLDNY